MASSTVFDDIFSPSGLLSKQFKGYERRTDQQKMSEEIWTAFEEKKSALFEAGTGIGKSLAYLIPALLWAHETNEKIVISTYTISLQEQLMEKDIPFLLDALGLKLNVVLAKGMNNYVCLRKMEDLSKQHALFEQEQEIDNLLAWAHKTGDGTRSSLSFPIANDLWSKIYAEGDACSYVKCPQFKQCFFFKARARVQDAHVIIVNHHLLMAHLLSDEKRAILPPFTRLVIDEAHHLEQVARSCLTQSIDRVGLFRAMARVHSDNNPEVSRLLFLRDFFNHKPSMQARLAIDLPGQKRELTTQIKNAFDQFEELNKKGAGDFKWRLTSDMLHASRETFIQLREGLKQMASSLDALEMDVKELLTEQPAAQNALLDIASTSFNLKGAIETIDTLFSKGNDEKVRYAEKSNSQTSLSIADLDVAPFLKERLFEPLKSAILCSATLTIEKKFDQIADNIGIIPSKTDIYPSPFDYQNRTKMLCITDLSPPTSPTFTKEVSQAVADAICITGGGAFVLFTSFEMLRQCALFLENNKFPYPLFKQGDLSRHLLLEKFKSIRNGVLLGTDSFWEGVDVPGDSLRLVIIPKLPFPVPSDPLNEARSEQLKKAGRDPFLEDSLPQAVIKFKQGFGRLMRRADDRGCVLCLDQRLYNRPYGKTFIRSLPDCVTVFDKKDAIFKEMKNFYKN